MQALVQLDGRCWHTDLGRGLDLARVLHFDAAAPRWFGAPAPRCEPLLAGGVSARVDTGASCNCSTLTLTPHGNGTHTESVGHLTREPHDVHAVAPRGLVAARVVTLAPQPAAQSAEGSDPAPLPQDLLITRQALEQAWSGTDTNASIHTGADAPAPQALIIRTRSPATDATDAAATPAAFLSREAAHWLVAKGITHLVLDVPSADRTEDHGRLTAHRIFFGLPTGSATLADATRPGATITELAAIGTAVADGPYLLSLQLPAIAGDAVPSRPVLYPLWPAAPATGAPS